MYKDRDALLRESAKAEQARSHHLQALSATCHLGTEKAHYDYHNTLYYSAIKWAGEIRRALHK